LFSGCSKDDLKDVTPSNEVSPDTPEYILFNNVKVLLPNGFSSESFELSDEEYIKRFDEKYFKSQNARSIFEIGEYISIEPFLNIVQREIEKYPQIDMFENNISNFDQLSKAFPNIESEEEAFKISNAIVEYYNIIIRESIASDVADMLKNNRKGQSIGSAYGSANSMELAYSSIHPLGASHMFQAVSDANTYTDIKFGPNAHLDQDNEVNALYHSVWNGFGMSKMLRGGFSKNNASDKARSIATFHEMEYKGNSNGIKPLQSEINYLLFINWGLRTLNSTAMDLSNNVVGRTHVDDIAYWKLFGGWQNVGLGQITDAMYAKTATGGGTMNTNSTNIIGVYHGNNWISLAENKFTFIAGNNYRLFRF
jgi:hypothetical protein